MVRVIMSTIRRMRRPSVIAMAIAAALSVHCRSSVKREPGNGGSDAACLADSVGTLRLLSSVPQCGAGDPACRLRCRLGDASACLALGYSADLDSAPEKARDLYRRACVLGAANACTNYAASVWTGTASDEEEECARRTFEKACAAKEQFACGMVGRVMLESGGTPDDAEGRRYLQKTCDQVGGFSCRVLARHLESGRFGQHDPASIDALLKRACAGGDVYACGSHATAEETFN
jgi:TPR repeat protein